MPSKDCTLSQCDPSLNAKDELHSFYGVLALELSFSYFSCITSLFEGKEKLSWTINIGGKLLSQMFFFFGFAKVIYPSWSLDPISEQASSVRTLQLSQLGDPSSLVYDMPSSFLYA